MERSQAGNMDQPRTTDVVRRFEDGLALCEKTLPNATGEAADALSKIRDFFKARLERAKEKEAPRSTHDDDHMSSVKSRLQARALPDKKPLPASKLTEPAADFSKGALD